METRTFICRECGKPFEMLAHTFEPGIEGIVVCYERGHMRFIKPANPQTCTKCLDEIRAQIREVEGSS